MENATGGSEWPYPVNTSNLEGFRLFRYMGILIHVANDGGGTNAFSQGTVKARIVTQGSLNTAVKSNLFSVGMEVS